MAQIRIFTPEDIFKDKVINLSKENYHYLVNVMRKNVGDQINIFNESCGEWVAFIIKIKKSISVKVKFLKRKPINQQDIWLCFGMTKSKKVKFLVEKVTEIGVSKIVPINTEFSEKIKMNVDKMRRVVIEATEQSNQINLPRIEFNVNLEIFVKNLTDDRLVILCDENLKSPNILDFLSKNTLKKLAVLIGPVGGWSEKDRFYLNELKNLYPVSLGSSVFKMDTASIFSVACCKIFMENLNE